MKECWVTPLIQVIRHVVWQMLLPPEPLKAPTITLMLVFYGHKPVGCWKCSWFVLELAINRIADRSIWLHIYLALPPKVLNLQSSYFNKFPQTTLMIQGLNCYHAVTDKS